MVTYLRATTKIDKKIRITTPYLGQISENTQTKSGIMLLFSVSFYLYIYLSPTNNTITITINIECLFLPCKELDPPPTLLAVGVSAALIV